MQKMCCAQKKKYSSIPFASCSLKSHAEHMEWSPLTRHCKEHWEHTVASLNTKDNSMRSNARDS